MPSSCGAMHVPGGGAVDVTLTVVVFATQLPGEETGFVVCAVTMFVLLPLAGENAPVKPAAVHVVRAFWTLSPTRLGTVALGLVQGGGPDVVTVTVAVATRHEPG